MIKHLSTYYWLFVIIFSIGGLYKCLPSHSQHNISANHVNVAQPIHRNTNQRNVTYHHHASYYRIYSQHYLTVEHYDLESLRVLGNSLARHTNDIYQNRFNRSGVIYHKFHDKNYWSIFKLQPVPGNFRKSHMNNQTYNLIQHRVLRSHGVYSGTNFHHQKTLPWGEI